MMSGAHSPFADLRAALLAAEEGTEKLPAGGGWVNVDVGRWRRTGIPEVVHAEAKSSADIASALRRLAEAQGRAFASRVRAEDVDAIQNELCLEFDVESILAARALVVSQPGVERPSNGGSVGILGAGTSDVAVATEAGIMAAEMGAMVLTAWDVGVAGLHRLVAPLERFTKERVDVIIVAAGMDGALPSVVTGLVDVPVIGLPTSIGYGFGGGGMGALTTMLQSCAPGLAVVNIDNGIGAGATAARIANRAAASRRDERIQPGDNDRYGARR